MDSVFSVYLVALTTSTYKKTGLKKLKYAIIAFSLFCFFLIYENLEHLYSFDNPSTDTIIPLTALTVLVFFFLINIKKTQIHQKVSYDE